MFIGYQVIFTVGYMVSVIVGLILEGNEELLHLVTPEFLLYNMDIVVIMLLSCIFTFLTMWLILRNEWRSTQVWKTSGVPVLPIVLCALLGIALQFLIGGTIYLTGAEVLFEDHAELMGMVVGNDLFMEILAIAIGAAVVEELIFRGVILKRFLERTSMKTAYAVILQAFLFGVIHMNILQGMYAFALGIVFGLVYIWVKSIWAPIALHLVFNLYAVLSSNLSVGIVAETPSTIELVMATVAAFLISAVFMMVIYKKRSHTLGDLQETAEWI